MLKQRIAVLVSGGGTNLQALIDAEKKGSLKSGELSLVISSKPSVTALERADRANIPNFVVDRKQAITGKAFEQNILKLLNEHEIDIIVLAGFMSVLSPSFVSRYPNKIINIHPSLIPSFSGAGFYGMRVHQAALEYGVKITGATVHFVNEEIDGGKIIMQKAVSVLPDDSPETLQRRVMEEAEWLILPAAVEEVCAQYAADK